MKPAQTISADIAIIGAGLGGVLAAWSACRPGLRVVLASRYDWLGGQMTAQGVPPDEHRLIEHGGASRSYQAFRAAMRAHYLAQPGFQNQAFMTEGLNPGDGWVSRLCFEPKLAADYFEALLAPLVAAGQLQILRHSWPVAAQRSGRRIATVDLQTANAAGWRVQAEIFIDATDTGDLLPLAGLPYRLGKEARHEFNEDLAPLLADRLDQQPVTHVIALRRHAEPGPVMPAPASYAFWRQHHLPHYGHALFSDWIPGGEPGQSRQFALFAGADPQDPTLDLWRYRRVVAAHQWQPARNEVSLINWAQNDYALQPLLDGPQPQAEVEAAARELSLCLLHWLQTEAPRCGGQGYPEMQAAPDVLGTPDGLAQQVYVRESRRIQGLETLSQPQLQAQPAMQYQNSVGIAWYMMDMHPTCVSGQGLNAHVRPFELPLGCFVPADCDNLLPASKNLSVTHLVNACIRVHPAEWLIGEVAGLLAAFVLQHQLAPAALYADPELTLALQQDLLAHGIPLHWDAALLARLD